MAIVHEFESIAIRKKAIVERYPGGLDAFRRASPNRAAHVEDEHLVRIGALNRGDNESHVAAFEKAGLRWLEDLAITARGWISDDVPWLATGEVNGADAFWLSMEAPGKLYWTGAMWSYRARGPDPQNQLDLNLEGCVVEYDRREPAWWFAELRRERQALDIEVIWPDDQRSFGILVARSRHERMPGFDDGADLRTLLDATLTERGVERLRGT